MYNNPILSLQQNSLRSSGNSQPPQQQQSMQSIKTLMNAIRMSNNPQGALQVLMSQNPSVKNAMDLIRMSGGNMQQVAQAMAQQTGTNLDELIRQLNAL